MIPTQWFSVLTLAAVVGATDFEPARFQSGSLAMQSPMTLGGGEVLLELGVDASGSVVRVETLRSTAPFTDLLVDAVRPWRFSPAREVPVESTEWVPVESKVLVAGVFRPPTNYDAPARGEAPEDVAAPSEAIPSPTSLVVPPYPPMASFHTGQSVLVEVEVGEDGSVTQSKVLRSEAGLEEVSKDAAAKWRFRPARREGKAVPSVAYVVFGFSEPVASRGGRN